jgi:hypothetical protein
MRFSALFLVVLLLVAACEGSEVPPLSEAERSEFGKVLVVASGHDKPFQTVRIERFVSGMAGGGTVSTISPAATALSGVLPALLLAEVLSAEASSITTPRPSSSVKESPPLRVETQIAAPITTAYPLHSLQLRIVDLAQLATEMELEASTGLPTMSARIPAPRDLAAAGFETILYVDVLAWGLAGKDEEDPPLLFFTQAHAKVRSASTGEEVYNKVFTHFGHTHRIHQWIANQENLLLEDIEDSVQQIATKIVEEVFLLWRAE